MSDPTREERREAAATRRRWITLAEVVAVAGVVIAALTLWNNWSDRRDDRAEKAVEERAEAREKSRIDLAASVADGGDTLTLKDEKHDLQDMTVRFPRALGISTQQPIDPAIDAGWFAAPLLKLTDGGPDERTGRLPVLIGVSYWDGDTKRTANGLYDIIWRTQGRMLQGRTLKLEALRLRQRSGSQAALDAAWSREKP